MNPTEKKRENWIDIIKGIAMLFIIIGHVSERLTGWWSFSWVYGIHVLVFFVLSGYTLKKRELTREYVNSRFARLMVPYFVTCLAVILMDIVNSRVIAHDFTVSKVAELVGRDLVRSFFASGAISSFGSFEIGTRIGAIWFLPAMFFANMIVQIVLQRVTSEKKQGMVMAAVMMAAVLTRDFFWLPFSIQAGMMGAFFVWVGYIVKERDILATMKWYHYLAAQGIYVWGYYNGYAFASIVQAKLGDVFLSTIVGMSGCILFSLIARKIEKAECLAFLGRISLTILCMHLFALETLGRYFDRILDIMHLEGNPRVWGLIGIEILFAVLSAIIIEQIKKYLPHVRKKCVAIFEKRQKTVIFRDKQDRDTVIDVVRGILILAMIIGNYLYDGTLRRIVFSCHVTAFIFLSGYFYKSPKSILGYIRHMVKALLLPYAVYMGLFFLLNNGIWTSRFFEGTIAQHLLGMSSVNEFFQNVAPVGPMSFILLLFMVKMIYMLLDLICSDKRLLTVIVIVVSVAGTVIGHKGYWLPWSLDIALYGLLYYHIGRIFYKYKVFDIVMKASVLYFCLSSLWAYFIYKGSTEIALRNYGSYGLAVIGSVSGVLVILQLSGAICKRVPVFRNVLCVCGRNAIYILLVHALMHETAKITLGKVLGTDYMPYMLVSILLELFIAMLVVGVKKGICSLEKKQNSGGL